MFKSIVNIFTRPIENVSNEIVKVVKTEKFLIVNDSKYQIPSITNSYVPIVDVDVVVESQIDLINRIKAVFGFSAEDFEELVMSAIKNYAQYVHLIPATRYENHCTAGGLFRLGLEVGYYAAQTSSGKLHPRKSGVSPSECHKKWVLATFIAGLCSQIYRPMTTMQIINDNGQTWPSPIISFYKWAIESSSTNFKITWSENAITSDKTFNSAAAYALDLIISQQSLKYLIDDNLQILSCLASTISESSVYSNRNSVGESVTSALSYAIERDLKL